MFEVAVGDCGGDSGTNCKLESRKSVGEHRSGGDSGTKSINRGLPC